MKIELNSLDKINYGLASNGRKIISEVKFINDTSDTFSNLKVEISSSLELFSSYVFYISYIDKYSTIVESHLDIVLNFKSLKDANEAQKDTLFLKAFDGEELIESTQKEVEVLSFDEWDGVNLGAESIANFVFPNNKAIDEIKSISLENYKRYNFNNDFCGYNQASKDDILKEICSVFQAIKSLDIKYSLAKASFEKEGQKIRLPREILSSKFATCLDLALLFDSVFESIGLNSLLVLTDNHAFVGVWLSDYHYQDKVIVDPAFLINKYNNKDVVFIECTLVTRTSDVLFNEAINAGFNSLLNAKGALYAVDILTCRINSIKPLPIQIGEDDKYYVEEVPSSNLDFSYDLENPGYIDGLNDKDRFDTWEKKLLDLNSRNKLISFTPGAKFVQVYAYDIYKLFDLIYIDSLSLYPLDDLYAFTQNEKIYEATSPNAESLFLNDLKLKRARLIVSQKQFLNTCRNIIRESKNALEESGTNTLFLTLGTLIYKEKGKIKYAPIILVPIDIYKGKEGQSFYLSLRDDEIVPNQTLLEYLKNNFDIDCNDLLKIPFDEKTNTYDIKPYINTFRKRITGISGFQVSETAFIGQFSFTRFIMWNDLRTKKDVFLKNDIIKSLVNPMIPFINKVDEINTKDLDDLMSPNKFAIPLSADSSQTEAILNASNGLSFVLNGPPGTGKSQTITNMIINSLYNHKKVLFVAQKMAALEVVKKRLDATGLGLFCIELHSNKAQKSDVLSQINNILETGKLKKPFEYELAANELLLKRNELNSIIKHLHSPLKNGFYLYENILGYEEVKNSTNKENISGIDFSNVTKEKFNQNIEEIGRFLVYKNEIGLNNIKYFDFIEPEIYSIEYRNHFESDLIELKHDILNLLDEINILKALNEDFAINFSRTVVNNFVETFNIYKNNHDSIYRNVVLSTNDESISKIHHVLSKIHDLNDDYIMIKSNFDPQVVDFYFQNLVFRLNRSKHINAISSLIERLKIKKELRSYCVNPSLIKINNLESILNSLTSCIDFNKELKEEKNLLDSFLGDDFKGFETNLSLVTSKLITSKSLKENLDSFNDEKEKFLSLFEYLYTNDCSKFLEKISKYIAKAQYFVEKYKFKFGQIDENNYLFEALEVVEYLIKNSQKLKDYIIYKDEYKYILTLNMGDLISRNLSRELQDYELIPLYKKTIHYNLSLRTIESDDSLNLFSGRKENEKISEYKKLINKYNELTIREVASRLSKSTSDFFDGVGDPNESKEFMYLKKAISSNGRGISLRNLFDATSDVIFDICPCFLMSPLSVAQYFDVGKADFDIVIFDEASQITTSDAIGALGRGKSAIIVGDEKQLPPTRFFEASTSEEDDLFVEDGDSILSDCLSISMPKKYLSWHYRSKDESLIAFSNAQYYENRLLTFPSPNAKNNSITFNYCGNAIYENRKNKVEAEAIVKEVERRLKDPILKEKSIGIVTFSISQQTLILDELQKLFRKCPELEYIQNSKNEELFVKNLENVQGDERDVIIFSICYGRDKNGRLSLNFGPLSNKGGERRLNVAISRAREEMLIYSSMLPEMIDVNRVTGIGSKNLREFLEYAMRGKTYILIKNGEQIEYEVGVEKYIAEDLRKRGFDVDIDVGTSEFRVDLAIIDRLNPEKYALGVLLDSKSYLNSKTSKDRNVTQAKVLEGLGWKIIRVWTLDYFDAPDLVVDKIIEAINLENEDEEEIKNCPIVFEKADKNNDLKCIEYRESIYPKTYDSDTFYEYLNYTKNVIDFYIRNEAPISYRLLFKKVLQTFDISRIGSKNKSIFDSLIPNFTTMTGDNKFIWKDANYSVSTYRVGSKYREFIDIPKEEIILCINDIMKTKLCLSRDELIHFVVVSFGFSKVTEISKSIINISIDFAVALKYVREEDNVIYLYSGTR